MADCRIVDAGRAGSKKPGTEWLAFLACAGMFFIGAAPNFKDIVEGGIHKMGAILCLVSSQAWVACNCPWCLMVWIAYVGYTVAMMVRNENDSIISDFLYINRCSGSKLQH